MPTVLRVRGHRFFFYSNEGNEPPHVHVEKDDKAAKFWLRPVVLASNVGYNRRELTELEGLVEQNQALFEEKWREHFGN